ncbi:MAG TPA: PAS domain S-box protein [Burkholderiales bacterium]|nr:PAS domain S-box protein [Burkholderiales bacterium]
MEKANKAVDPRVYRLLIEQARDYALFVLDPAGRIQTWNLGAQRLKGYAPDEIIGRHFSVFYTSGAVQRGWPAYELKVATSEGRFEDEGWRVRKDGSRFWANVVITALRDDNGKLIGFSKITRDLTQRREQEEALRQSEERLRLMIESVQDYAIYMLDPEGLISSWNTGAERIKGYSREHVLGRHFSLFYEAADVEAGKPWEELAQARREGHAEGEGWRIRKDGSRFWARFVVSPVHDDEGRLRGFAKVTQDLTKQRHMQDLEKAAANVSEFLGILAHELRNPLAPIRLATEVMARHPAGEAVHETMRKTIERQTTQLVRLVDDLLDTTRVTRGQLALKREPVDLDEVVRLAVETATPFIEQSHHRLEVNVPRGLGVMGDAQRLTQALANLLNNAARYTPAGGAISVEGGIEGRCALIRVRDTGRGIEPEMLERIFGMFVQGLDPVERVGSGLGIGLALARRIIELHGGRLIAASEGKGRGSVFTLELPLAAVEMTQSEGRGATPVAAQSPKRILIVDDNVDSAVTLGHLLRSLGHETEIVHDGASALRAAEAFRPQIVLLDIGLPDGMDGYEVARRLRHIRREEGFRIVAITGWGQEADRQRAREAGFDLHLVKPVDPTELAATLH